MFDPSLNALFQGAVVLNNGDAAPSQGILIPLTALPELTPDEAANDSRQVIGSLTQNILKWYDALSPADRPTQLQVLAGQIQPIAGQSERYRKPITVNPVYEHGTQANVAPEN